MYRLYNVKLNAASSARIDVYGTIEIPIRCVQLSLLFVTRPLDRGTPCKPETRQSERLKSKTTNKL